MTEHRKAPANPACEPGHVEENRKAQWHAPKVRTIEAWSGTAAKVPSPTEYGSADGPSS